jgi:endoglucanase
MEAKADSMSNEIRDLLEKLSNAHGISGYEGDIADILEKELEPYVDEIRRDKVGNLICKRKGSSPSIMLAAHMDEIGLMTKYIDENGFIRFVCVGGWFDQTLLNQRVLIHGSKGYIHGVIGSKPPHRMEEEERKKLIKADDMFIDVGAKSKEDTEEMGISQGSPISIGIEFKDLTNDMVTGKAFDNRAGIVMMIEAMKRSNAATTIYAVGTVQEEVGLKGARTSAFDINPDVAIATEIAIPGDHPGIEKKDSSIEMGKGPVITVLDSAGRGIITPEPVLCWLRETAEKNDIPYQLEVSTGGTTDATAILLSRSGIPSGVIGVPCRYIHSPVEVLNLNDLDKCASLLARSMESLSDYFD